MLFEDVSRFRRIVGVLHAYLFNAQTVFLLLIELPSVLGPMLLEVSRVTGLVSVNDFNLFVSVLLAILLVRFFQEGQVIPALKLLVLTMVQATEQLVNFMIIVSVHTPPQLTRALEMRASSHTSASASTSTSASPRPCR